MSTTSRDIYDVLYEAGESLAPETIVARTWERATSAAQGHAMRQLRSKRLSDNRYWARKKGLLGFPEGTPESESILAREAWRPYIRRLLSKHRWNGTLLVDEQGRFSPNPEKPPRAERVDGSTYRYTREAWLETTQQERTTGEIHTMTMEAERFLGGRSQDELLLVLELLVDDLSGFGKEKPRPVNPRTIRSQLHWLLERPTTDESRAWLLHELTRRIYGS